MFVVVRLPQIGGDRGRSDGDGGGGGGGTLPLRDMAGLG
jgi:hypothetical protein